MKCKHTRFMLKHGLALLLAIRCQQKEATLQLLNRIYHLMTEKDAKILMNRVIYLVSPKERDWLKGLT